MYHAMRGLSILFSKVFLIFIKLLRILNLKPQAIAITRGFSLIKGKNKINPK
nr:MAG TPA: hypothetical protein [Myoviridae sp. ctLGX4]